VFEFEFEFIFTVSPYNNNAFFKNRYVLPSFLICQGVEKLIQINGICDE
jgi:hypothetical protein